MTSLPAALRLPTSGRSFVIAAAVALSATVALGMVTGAAASTAPEGLVRQTPPSSPAAAALAPWMEVSAEDGGGRTGGEAPRSAAMDSAGSSRAAASAGVRWLWPLHPRPPVLRSFRAPLTTFGAGHRGLDLGAPVGAPVLAVEAGVVTHAGMVGGRGTVTVTHADGLRSTYEPVRPTVVRGGRVVTGDVLGTLDVGGGHCAGRGCLHLGARRGDAYLDPMPLLVTGRLALLPVGPVR